MVVIMVNRIMDVMFMMVMDWVWSHMMIYNVCDVLVLMVNWVWMVVMVVKDSNRVLVGVVDCRRMMVMMTDVVMVIARRMPVLYMLVYPIVRYGTSAFEHFPFVRGERMV